MLKQHLKGGPSHPWKLTERAFGKNYSAKPRRVPDCDSALVEKNVSGATRIGTLLLVR